MKQQLAAFIAGLLFAVGLVAGGMTDPNKVINFLDIAGDWDPSLAFVMGGAILVYAPLFRIVTKRPAPLFDATFHLPTRKDIDGRLILGAVLFGAGWGLGGFCPGPALVGSMSLMPTTLAFTASMLAGMAGFSAWQKYQASKKGD